MGAKKKQAGGQAAAGAAPKPEDSKAQVSGFKISATRTAKKEDIISSLSPLSFLEIAIDGDAVVVINIESRDISNNPYLFSILFLKPDSVELQYTYIPGMSPKKRKLDVIRYFINIATLLGTSYNIEMSKIYQLLENALGDMSEYVSLQYDTLFSLYDNTKGEIDQMRHELERLRESNKMLSRENYELKLTTDELRVRLTGLETYSDEVLGAKLQEWISEHQGEINVFEFAKVHKVSEGRIDDMLNKLVREGYMSSR